MRYSSSSQCPFHRSQNKPSAIDDNINRTPFIDNSRPLLEAISAAQIAALNNPTETESIFSDLLDVILNLTQCEYGFIGEMVFEDEVNETGPYLRTQAFSFKPIEPLEEDALRLFEYCRKVGFKFNNMHSLFGAVMLQGKPLVTNDPRNHPESSPNHVPKGHPPMHSFLGLPFLHGSRVVGMVGIANRANGFDVHEDVELLTPLMTTCASILVSRQNYLKRIEVENNLEMIVAARVKELHETNIALTDEIKRREEVEMQLTKEKKRAEQAVIEKNRFITTISHDVRTPLNSIIAMSEVLERSGLSKDQLEYLSLIRLSGKMLLHLVSSILDVSKLEAQKIDLHQVPDDLRQTIDTVLEVACYRSIFERGVEVIHKFDPAFNNPRLSIAFDKYRVSQILVNILSNAAKFTHQGKIVLSTKLLEIQNETSDISSHIATIQFCIEDTGIGMEQTFLDQIGTPFVQYKKTSEGTGLGLVIVKALISLMNGTFSVTSQKGIGSTFAITLKLPAILEEEFEHERFNLIQLLSIRPSDIEEYAIVLQAISDNSDALSSILKQLGINHIRKVKDLEDLNDAVQQYRSDGKRFVVFVDPCLCPRSHNFELMCSDLKMQPETDKGQRFFFTSYLTRGCIPPSHRVLKPFKLLDVYNQLYNSDLTVTTIPHYRELRQPSAARFGRRFSEPTVTPISTSIEADHTSIESSLHTLENEEATQQDQKSSNGISFLVVEDNILNRKVITHLLGQLGHTNVTIAVSGQEAIEQVRRNFAENGKVFDIILMDIMLGAGIDGFEASKRITRYLTQVNQTRTKIAALTAHVFDEEDLSKCRSHGMVGTYLSKPITLRSVSEFLSNVQNSR